MQKSVNIDPTLVVDIGNTNIVCAVVVQNEVLSRFRFESNRNLLVEDYYSQLRHKMQDYPLASFKFAAIGSVVPRLTEIFVKLLSEYSLAKVYQIDGLSDIGLRYLIEDRSVVGPDLVANAFGAWKKYDMSTIIVDMGTATTIQLVDKDGLYAGVIIAPGVKTAASHLFDKAALLNNVEIKAPKQLMGNSTKDALLSGIITGHAMMLRGFLAEIKVNYAQYAPFKVIMTGGLANVIAPMCVADYVVDQNLTIDGLVLAMHALLQKESE